MNRFFLPHRDFRSLSIRDLLEAREAYHTHLVQLENVVATAIGLYRIRKTDGDAQSPTDAKDIEKRGKLLTARTLQNTVIQPWSWPCLLVFVDEWVEQADIVKNDPDQVVPRFLYMPDGRVIPTCVVCADKQDIDTVTPQNLNFPSEIVGGGYPVITDVQGREHIGSIGCLVTDGNVFYALTNRHVTGEAGTEIFSLFRAERQQIGTSHHNQLGKKPFSEVYPGWPGERVFANLDAGLIEITDLNCWTAQTFGIGELDDPIDLNTDTISLDLIGCPVRAFGAASGELVGEIQALFYRYRSIGGFDYTSDLLIGPRDNNTPLNTHPGDSGTVWFFDDELTLEQAKDQNLTGARARRLHPIALQWGGHVLLDNSGESKLQFALATCLSTICRELDVDIVRGWNIGHSEYWGQTGHYKIAAKACELVSNAKLKGLLGNNVDRISFDDPTLQAGNLKIDSHQFVPLADVADIVWRNTRRRDASNHFADMDQPGQGDFENQTLLDLCENHDNLNIPLWNQFYDTIETPSDKRGALPFRVWQIYDQMVEFLKAGKVAEFVCASGIMSHYVGDACQPLHVSMLHHGHPDHPEEKNVHSDYETKMVDRFAEELITGVNQHLQGAQATPDVTGGREAALAVVQLMRTTIQKLPPADVVTAFNEKSGAKRLPHMFEVLGDRTITCLADGCLCLASLWESAWKDGNGAHIPANKLVAIKPSTLQGLYNKATFLPAYELGDAEYAAALSQDLVHQP